MTEGERAIFSVALVTEWRFRRQHEHTQTAMDHAVHDAFEAVLLFRNADVGSVDGETEAMLRDMLGWGDRDCSHVECPEPVPKSCDRCPIGTGKADAEDAE